MFIVQAHSFAQQARLAITLAWVAGYTNILTVLTCGHVTSHVSGTTSDLGRAVADGAWGPLWFAAFLLGSFFAGAVLSGLLTEFGRRRGWESIYVLPMAAEAVLLAGFAVGVEMHEPGVREMGVWLYAMTGPAALAMGVQNATITRISGGVVRTTHMTGVVTDLGLELAQFVLWIKDRGRNSPPAPSRALLRSVRAHPTARRLALLASILGSFALGALLGTLAYAHTTRFAMFPPVAFLIWIVYQDLTRPIVEIEPSELHGGEGGDSAGLDRRLAVFHLRRDKDRTGKVHRMPNLQAWADRLEGHIRVVILDLGDVTHLDANSAMEVVALIRASRQRGWELVLAGIDAAQFEQLQAAGAGEGLDYEHVCPDLELAIARGLNLLQSMGEEERMVNAG